MTTTQWLHIAQMDPCTDLSHRATRQYHPTRYRARKQAAICCAKSVSSVNIFTAVGHAGSVDVTGVHNLYKINKNDYFCNTQHDTLTLKILKYMLKGILSIAGKPGLYRLVNPGKNMLIVEGITTGKRFPAYARDKVISLGDISMYTVDGDIPLADVMESLKTVAEGKTLDYKKMNDQQLREYFDKVLPTWDRERVYMGDIKKLYSWYNLLIEAGIDSFKEAEAEAVATAVATADAAETAPEA